MGDGRTWLRWGAWLTAATSLLHLAIIVGGPAWYRFFGAGERMARLAAGGAPGPAVVTAVLIADGPYAEELRGRMTFMVGTSFVCLGLALCYAAGAVAVGGPSGGTDRAARSAGKL